MSPFWYDAIIVIVLLYATARGAQKGLILQLAWIVALVLMFVFAKKISPVLMPYLPAEEPLNRWLSMLIVYILFAFVAFAAAHKVGDWMERLKFMDVNRHLGGLFGLVKGAVFALVLTFFLVTLSDSARDVVLKSHSGFAAAILMDRLHPMMPEEIHEVLEPYIHKLDNAAGGELRNDDQHSEKSAEKSEDKMNPLLIFDKDGNPVLKFEDFLKKGSDDQQQP